MMKDPVAWGKWAASDSLHLESAPIEISHF